MVEYTEKSAFIDLGGLYRYKLSREWAPELPCCMFIGLNPSTADADRDDPTIRRCVGFARRWGYGKLVMCNLFAFRATDPAALFEPEDPVGPENDEWLIDCAERADLIVAAWGARGDIRGRAHEVRTFLPEHVHHLGLTKFDQPRHPLYLRADTRPVLW